MRKLLFSALFLVVACSIVFAQEIPTLQKYVNDDANVLSSSDIARINALAAEIEDNTTVQVAVLTLNSTQPMTIEEYAVKVFEQNGVGHADTDNGILIVAAIDDRRWRIEVGYGLEPIINDAKAGLIGRTYMTPAFQEEMYGDGLYDAVSAIYQVIQNSGDTSFISEQVNEEDVFILIFVLFMFIIFLIPMAIALSNNFQKCPKCGGRMKCHYEGDYIVCECLKCKKKIKKKRKRVPFWFFFFTGSGGHGGGGYGGGGFGGGSSGGGGASGGW